MLGYLKSSFISLFSHETILLFFSIFLFATAVGIDIVTFPSILSKHGFSPFKIGIASGFEVIAAITMSFFLGKIISKFGLFRSLFFSSTSYAIAIAIIFFCKNFYLWIAVAFLMGTCWFAYNVLRQAWLNIIINEQQRGIVAGIYSAMISAGLAIGPVIVKFLGAENYSSFLASSFLVLLSFTILTPLKKMPAPQITSQKIPLAEFFKTNSRCFLGRFFLDLQCFCMLAFTVIYGKKIGLSAEDAGLLITAYMTSGFLDIFIGILIKKFNPYKLINLSFIGSLVCILIICLFHESYKLLLLTYFWFGTFGAVIYIASITITNNDYPKEKLIGANSTLQRIASSGSLCGTLLGGISIQIFGEAGFPIAIIFSCIGYLIFHVIYEKKYAQKN